MGSPCSQVFRFWPERILSALCWCPEHWANIACVKDIKLAQQELLPALQTQGGYFGASFLMHPLPLLVQYKAKHILSG